MPHHVDDCTVGAVLFVSSLQLSVLLVIGSHFCLKPDQGFNSVKPGARAGYRSRVSLFHQTQLTGFHSVSLVSLTQH